MKNISLNTIFSNWYKDVYGTAQDSATQSVSIFSHTSEFKEFLVCEMDVDSSIYSKSLSEILSMDFSQEVSEEVPSKNDEVPEYFVSEDVQVNDKGEFVFNSENLSGSQEEGFDPMAGLVQQVYGYDVESEEGQKILEQLTLANLNNESGSYLLIDGNNALNSQSGFEFKVAKQNIKMDDVLTSLLEDEEMMSYIDTDTDNELSQEEIDLFFENIKNLDGNDEDISLDDILQAVQGLKDGQFDFLASLTEPTQEEVQNVSKPSGSSGGGSFQPSVQNQEVREKTLDQYSVEELNTEYGARQNVVKDKQALLENLTNGTGDSQLEALKQAMEQAQQAYQAQVQLVDTDLAQELEKAQKDVDDNQKNVDDYTIKISAQEVKVSEATINATNAQTRLDSLLMTQASLDATDTSLMNPEAASDINQNKQAIKDAIAQAQQAKQTADTALETAKQDLETLKGEKTVAQQALAQAQQTQQDIDSQIAQAYPELQAYQQAYNKAKTDYETYKTTAISQTQKDILTAQESVNEVATALSTKEIRDEVKEYSPSAMAQYNEEEGERIAKAALEYALAGHSTSCGASVRIVLESLGYTGIEKCMGKEWAERNLAGRDDFVEVTTDTIIQDFLKEKGGSLSTTDFNELIKTCPEFEEYFLNYLPVGTIVCFGEYEYFGYGPGTSGHVGIVTSKDGHYVEASGYVREGGTNTNLIKHGAELRAFIPC